MTDTRRVKYHPVPSSEDHADHEADTRAVGEDDPRSTSEWISAKAQTRWTYFLLGCAILLPWNALINATPFFLSRLAGSSLYLTFSPSLSSVYTITNLVCQFYCTFTSKQSSPSRRIFASITVTTLFVASLCFSTFVQGTPSGFFTFALFNGGILAATTSYLCTAVFAGAALFGSSCLQTVLSGQAAIAVAVSAVQLASSVISLWGSSSKSVPMEVIQADDRDDQAEAMAARMFFGVSTIFLGITLFAYAWLTRQPYYKSVARALEQHRQVGDTEERSRLLADDCASPVTGTSGHVYRVFKQNWIFMFSIAYVFAVTLALYPAITVRVRSVDPHVHPLLFTSIHFLMYNAGDLIGRNSCSYPRLVVWSAKKILAMALLRTLFIPLLLLSNVDRPEITLTSPIINSDILFMMILLAMGYTNGYVSTLALLAASSLEHNPRLEGRHEDVDVAATLGGAFVNVGLASGALSSFGVQTMI